MNSSLEMLQNVLLGATFMAIVSFLVLHFTFYQKQEGMWQAIRDLFSVDVFRRIRDCSRSSMGSERDRCAARIEWAFLCASFCLALVYGVVSLALLTQGSGFRDGVSDRAVTCIALLRIYHPDRDVRAEDRITLRNVHRFIGLCSEGADVIEKVALRLRRDAEEVETALRDAASTLRLTYVLELGPGHFALHTTEEPSLTEFDLLREFIIAVAERTISSTSSLNTGRRTDSMERIMIDVLQLPDERNSGTQVRRPF